MFSDWSNDTILTGGSDWTGDNVNGAETCIDQASCLGLHLDSGMCTNVGSDLYCKVCLYWDNSRGTCVKSVGDSISHVCLADEFYETIPAPGYTPVKGLTNKLDGWNSGSASECCRVPGDTPVSIAAGVTFYYGVLHAVPEVPDCGA